MSCNLTWLGLQHCRTILWEKGFLVTEWVKVQSLISRQYVTTHWLPSIREFFRFFRRKSSVDEGNGTLGGLNANIPLPSTGEEAMHRLLACKGRDPYSILGKSFMFSVSDFFLPLLMYITSKVLDVTVLTKKFDVTISDKQFWFIRTKIGNEELKKPSKY